MTHTEPLTGECERCGEELESHEIEEPYEPGRLLCSHCWHQAHYPLCNWCNDCTRQVTSFIITPAARWRFNMAPGVYMILQRPFFFDYIVEASIMWERVRWRARCPASLDDEEQGLLICSDCARRAQRLGAVPQ